MFPAIGARPIKDITPPELLAAIYPIENEGKHELAHRMLQTCGQIYRYGIATGRVTHNHEYYHSAPMLDAAKGFSKWLSQKYPNAIFLQDEAVTIGGVHFFGGTMWTDFNERNEKAMLEAMAGMNDYRVIKQGNGIKLTPYKTATLHEAFVASIKEWFEQPLTGPRVVISHHAPVVNPNTRHGNSLLMPAFNSLDMIALIDQYQPELWVYGHTHECDDHHRGKTRIISNQCGYPDNAGGYECQGFDPEGLPIEISNVQ